MLLVVAAELEALNAAVVTIGFTKPPFSNSCAEILRTGVVAPELPVVFLDDLLDQKNINHFVTLPVASFVCRLWQAIILIA